MGEGQLNHIKLTLVNLFGHEKSCCPAQPRGSIATMTTCVLGSRLRSSLTVAVSLCKYSAVSVARHLHRAIMQLH